MYQKVNLIQKRRVFSEEFKREMVTVFESGQFSIVQLSKLYSIAAGTLYKWVYRYSTFNEKGVRIVEMKESSTHKLKELEHKIKELEQIVGQKQIQIDFLEKMMDLAKKDLQIDIKKNYSTPQSVGSEQTKKS